MSAASYFKAGPDNPAIGYTIEDTAADGTVRKMTLMRNSTGFRILIATHYAGEAEPVQTVLCLGTIGMAMLTHLLSSVHQLQEIKAQGESP